jgi:hypothetical protein
MRTTELMAAAHFHLNRWHPTTSSLFTGREAENQLKKLSTLAMLPDRNAILTGQQ